MRFTRTLFLFSLLVLCILFLELQGCAKDVNSKTSYRSKKGSTVLVYAEDFWWEYLASHSGFSEQLRSRIMSHGYRLKLIRTNSETAADSWKALSLDRNRLVLLSPFTMSVASVMAEHFPSTLFLVLNAPVSPAGTGPLPPNLATLTFDKTDTYRKAGRIAGKLLSAQNKAPPENPGSAPKKCGILFLPLSEQTKQEVQAFREGFAEENSPAFLLEKEIADPNDRVKIKKKIGDMRAKGAIYFLIKMYTLTGYCLESLQSEKEWAIVDDWSRAGAYEKLILFSVEEDYLGAIEESLRAVRSQDTAWDRVHYEGPSRIVWGKHNARLKEIVRDIK